MYSIKRIQIMNFCLPYATHQFLPKTLDIRRLCTDRGQDVAVIFSFGLDILFTRDSRAHSSAVLSLLYYWLLLALTVI
jgi:hypothetical protein